MATAIMQKKADRLFDTFDADHNGRLTRDDFTRMGSGMAAAGGDPEGSPRYAQVMAAYDRLWDGLRSNLDANADGEISREEFASSALWGSSAQFRELIAPLADAIFAAYDTDGDGRLSRAEMLVAARAHSVSEADMMSFFDKVDTNGDGYLDRAEHMRSVEEFYTSDDPKAAGNILFGPV
ncbi:EF-hand domain-containing protein [Pseudonocardia sp. TRM90224]|uniref:EF-hand domain-containing protein n=1 Tax=Pseudonocardia sp. TRM90224 TaxID=2812678 RepID=UPI001E47EA7F|nr:EF-hand domain-containing protein [Pseudonocardia sp. TRM90224]